MPATVLLVFGRGVVRTDDGFALTAASTARVLAAAAYVRAHEPFFARAAAPRIVFTGGWPEASEGTAPPPAGAREGDLMLAAAQSAGLGDHADLHAETRSRSTLENLLHTVEDRLLSGYGFGATRPLGLVSHAWHLPRVRFLAGKVLGLRGPALLDVPATGGEDHNDRGALLAARFGFAGVRRAHHLLRRERRMVAVLRATEQLRRRSSRA
ncbi:hypothetical protein Ari01nite_08290 [Paractinoplanes rishiriensis]|uniref:DUF218 domain-containing protein n=1 Tax=Paractinoplanes rishiriensis TaxID=1050105 RepID=A0A919JU74_9ACTN|nr:hypothetical protein Ari01nite_08290 [Actinoplanes rishiriensis]